MPSTIVPKVAQKVIYMSSNGPLERCYKVLYKHLIGHVLKEQNEGSTIRSLLMEVGGNRYSQ